MFITGTQLVAGALHLTLATAGAQASERAGRCGVTVVPVRSVAR